MAQPNPIADQLKQQDEQEKLLEELRRAERRFMLAKARFDPEGFLADAKQERPVSDATLPQQREAEQARLQAALSSGMPARGQFFNINPLLPEPAGIGGFNRVAGAIPESANLLAELLLRLGGGGELGKQAIPSPFR